MAKKQIELVDKSKIMNSHFDVGIYGWWGHENFGGCLTYFALERTVRMLGYSVLMIQEASGLPGRYIIPQDTVAMTHANTHYNCSPQLDFTELGKFNDICDKFMVGGDQLWNHDIPFVKEDSFLSFVRDDKIKISYSTSFGDRWHNPRADHINKMSPLLKRFDAISVREDYAVRIAEEKYGAKAVETIDAVFLPDVKEYVKLAEEANCPLPKKYLLAFILNPSIEKRRHIEAIAKKLNLEIVAVPDAAEAYHEQFAKIFDGINILSPLSLSNFVKAYYNADYVVTDSFHGTCMSYVFKKNFNVYYNEKRGTDRFVSLMNTLKLDSRRIYENQSTEELLSNENVGSRVNWKEADANVSAAKKFSLDWLKTSLSKKAQGAYPSEIVNPAAKALHSNFDFIKIRLLATLLRDYGVRHIVLSPGGRDVPIIRMFEYNSESFILHSVTDERSAAYFALGLAAQLKAPVACVCTSGTAASNYLPAVTEAYYTGVPLIVITADRYGVYLNHGEDQTIPQKNIYDGVVKMKTSLPDVGGYLAEYQTRRDISTCILEATHNGWGPVHINVPIQDISIGANVPKFYWRLLPHINPHILRVSFNNGESDMYRWVDALKKSPRILLVYGQTPPLTPEQHRDVERFASRYNCAIITDALSNFKSDYAVEPFNMLNAISQEEFDRTLSPDIVISVGGKRLMNDPVMYKLRGGRGIRHWSVTADGKVKDLYFKLSSVIECTQYQFFRWFADKAADASNTRAYLNAWKSAADRYNPPQINDFNAHYIQSKFIPAVPSNSMLHLGVGQSFYDMRRYKMNPGIEVFCNMGTNGIDGCTSTFMGQCAIERERLCFLLVGDLSFFYDMNSIWNKKLGKNVRIMLVNNNGTGLLRGHNLNAVSSVHNTKAEGWVRSNSFEYMSASSKEEFDDKMKYFISNESDRPLFFEVFCN